MRSALRAGTRAAHDATEALFDRFDLVTDAGLQATLRAHIGALTALLPSLAADPLFAGEASRLRDLALGSLEHSSGVAETFAAPEEGGQAIPALAAAYVIFGSRLGSRVIARRLMAAGILAETGAHAYFCDQGSGEAWQSLLSQLDAYEDCEAALVDGANAAFAMFQEQAELQNRAIARGL